jgi:hypothetical protein
MSAAKLKAVAPVERDVEAVAEARRVATYHLHNLLMDAADALKALARGDDCADARKALQPALLPPTPKAAVDQALAEWT